MSSLARFYAVCPHFLFQGDASRDWHSLANNLHPQRSYAPDYVGFVILVAAYALVSVTRIAKLSLFCWSPRHCDPPKS